MRHSLTQLVFQCTRVYSVDDHFSGHPCYSLFKTAWRRRRQEGEARQEGLLLLGVVLVAQPAALLGGSQRSGLVVSRIERRQRDAKVNASKRHRKALALVLASLIVGGGLYLWRHSPSAKDSYHEYCVQLRRGADRELTLTGGIPPSVEKVLEK